VGGFLRFVAWFALLVGGFVLIGLPLLAGPLMSGVVRDMGVRADTIEVSVALFDPGLVVGRSRQVTVSATNVDLAPAKIGSFRIVLSHVSFFDRSFGDVSGELNDVRLTLGNDTVAATTASIDGPADAAAITARFAAPQVERLITIAAAHNGLTLDEVRVTDAGVKVTLRGIETDAQLRVRGGALLLDPGLGGTVVLIQPAPSDPWRLTDAWFSDRGLNLAGTIDVAQVVRDLAGATGATGAG
jgi:hypothetical protein